MSQELLNQLRSEGFTLRVEDGVLLVSPAAKLTSSQRKLIAQQRERLLQLLAWSDRDERALDAYMMDSHEASSWVELVTPELVTLDDRTVAMPPGRWEQFVRDVAAWNKTADEAWANTYRRKGVMHDG